MTDFNKFNEQFSKSIIELFQTNSDVINDNEHTYQYITYKDEEYTLIMKLLYHYVKPKITGIAYIYNDGKLSTMKTDKKILYYKL